MMQIDTELSRKLALACKILVMTGHGNLTMGHITARRPGDDFLHMNPHDLGLEEMTPEDMILIDFEGNQLAGAGRKHSEFPIHTEIYKKNPHIHCVIHTHPFYCIALSAAGHTIQTISHEGSLFSNIPVFKETTLLIRSVELGGKVAGALGGHRALLMQNHGVVVAGTSVEEATVYAALLERAAKLQVTAMQIGALTATGASESAGKGEQVFYSKNIQEFWNYYVRRLAQP
ncbi:MAG: class II aldolase/adducin family protein [Thermodesulfobacteriota bacterium]